MPEITLPLIRDPEIARRLGEVLLEAHYGQEEVVSQRPLIVTDKGDYWQVDGSFNRDRKTEGSGSFFMSVQKRDGRVTDIDVPYIYRPHPEAMAIIETDLRRKKAQGEPAEFPDLYTQGRMLQLINFARGGLISDSETARRVAALFLEAHYGNAEVELLRPLVVADKADRWEIASSTKRSRAGVLMSVNKYDARITGLDSPSDY